MDRPTPMIDHEATPLVSFEGNTIQSFETIPLITKSHDLELETEFTIVDRFMPSTPLWGAHGCTK